MTMHYKNADPGLSLRKRRPWFADDDEQEQPEGTQEKGQGETVEASAETENTGKDREPMIPRDRFDEVNSRLKEAQETLAKIEEERKAEQKKAEKAAADQLAEQGKFKELFEDEKTKVSALETEKGTLQEQLTAATTQIETMTALFQAQLDKRLEDVPDYVRDLLKEKPVLEAIAWLNEHADELEPQRTGAPRVNAADGLRSRTVIERGLNKKVRL